MDASVKHQNGATLRDLGHLHPVGISEDSESILVDTTHPGIEPMPELADEDAQEAALKVLRWVLEATGREGIVTKILALRFVLRLEPESMESVAKKHGISRAAISKYCTMFADSLGMPSLRSNAAREAYSNAQRRRRKNDSTAPVSHPADVWRLAGDERS